MKKNKTIFWIATIIIFIWEGLLPLGTLLFAREYANAGTQPLGYPDYFAYALIIFKAFGATALVIPTLPSKLKEWAYAGLSFSLIFAIISHIVVDQVFMYVLLPIIAGAILAVSYIYNQKIHVKSNR